MDLQEHIHVIQAGWAAPQGHPAGNTSGQWDTAGGCWLMIVRQDFILFQVPCNTQQIKYPMLEGNQLPRGDQKTLLKMTLWLRSLPQKCFTLQRHLWGYWTGETGNEDQQGQPVTQERACLSWSFSQDISMHYTARSKSGQISKFSHQWTGKHHKAVSPLEVHLHWRFIYTGVLGNKALLSAHCCLNQVMGTCHTQLSAYGRGTD